MKNSELTNIAAVVDVTSEAVSQIPPPIKERKRKRRVLQPRTIGGYNIRSRR